MNTVNPQLVQDFFTDYLSVEKEFARPQEDVVTLSVCQITKNAVRKLLTIYLDSKNISFLPGDTLQSMIDLCLQNNEAFSHIDYSPLICRCESAQEKESSYCINIQKTQECFSVLEQIKKIVFDELKIRQ